MEQFFWCDFIVDFHFHGEMSHLNVLDLLGPPGGRVLGGG